MIFFSLQQHKFKLLLILYSFLILSQLYLSFFLQSKLYLYFKCENELLLYFQFIIFSIIIFMFIKITTNLKINENFLAKFSYYQMLLLVL